MNNDLVIFNDGDLNLEVSITPENETVWLTANQMAVLFAKDEKTIRKHVNNVFQDEELIKENNTQKMRVDGVKQLVLFYNLDVIISVGYRVKSKRGIAFRKWANAVLKDYIMKGYAVNNNRMNQLNEVIQVMKRVENTLDAKQILSVIEKYSLALDMLDDYDHQAMTKPAVNGYEACTFGAFDDNDEILYGSIGTYPYSIRYDGQEVMMRGVGNVATLPSYRRKGAVTQCMSQMLKDSGF